MFNHFIHFVITQRLLVLISTAIMMVLGVLAWRALPIDAFPDVTNVQVMVLTEAPGLPPVEVEQRITFPIENALQGLPYVSEVRSLSKAGLSQVIVVFNDGTDIYFCRQLVSQRLQSAKENLPSWALPEMGPISTGLGEIYQYTLEGSGNTSAMDLRTLQDWFVAPQLRALAGVNEVNSFGGYVKQFHVLVDPQSLRKYGLQLCQVSEALENNNGNAGGGFITEGWEQAYVRTDSMLSSIKDIEEIALKAKDGTPVLIRDIAKVEIGAQPRQGAVSRDGNGESVAGMVIMLRGENSKIVVDRVKKTIPAIQASLPEGVRISPFYDRTSLIEACISTISNALLQGSVLVIAILFILLGNLRLALISAMAVPISAVVAVLIMGWQNVSANLMSLGGLAISLGMVVDAAIVVSENVMRHLTHRTDTPRTAVIREAVMEVARPVLFAALIVIVVFAPLLTLEGMEGKMYRPLALTMCFAMVGSLIAALVVVPPLCHVLLKGGVIKERKSLMLVLQNIYLWILNGAIRYSGITITVSIVLFCSAICLIPRIGTEFLPTLNEGAIAVNVVRLPSASLEGSVAVGTLIEKRLKKYPEVSAVVTKTGRAEISEDPMGPEQNDFIIMLHPENQWTTGRTKATLTSAIEADFASIPGIRPSFSQPIALRVNELISGVKSDLAIKIFGTDLDLLKTLADQVASVLMGIEGASDIKVEQVSGSRQIVIVPDRSMLSRHHINTAELNELVETAIGGKIATTLIEGQMRFAVVTRFPEEYRNSLQALNQLLVPTPTGANLPLSQLATIKEVEAPAQISRENATRRVVVECNIKNRDMGSFVSDVKIKLAEVEKKFPTGTYLRFGGQFENQERAMARLSIVVPVSIGLIFLMLFFALGSLRGALLVLANLPFALVGGIITMLILDIRLSVSTTVGFIALFGTAVGNGTVLVSFLIELTKEGLAPLEAVKKACMLRFRPLMMTTLTTLLGFLPMVYATGSGSELQRPLAVVVLGGMVSAFILTMLVLPVLYCQLEKRWPTKLE